MKNQERNTQQIYQTPEVEVIEIAVEQGFSASNERFEKNDDFEW